jgi:CHASE2 domain-containing sensor protein
MDKGLALLWFVTTLVVAVVVAAALVIVWAAHGYSSLVPAVLAIDCAVVAVAIVRYRRSRKAHR